MTSTSTRRGPDGRFAKGLPSFPRYEDLVAELGIDPGLPEREPQTVELPVVRPDMIRTIKSRPRVP